MKGAKLMELVHRDMEILLQSRHARVLEFFASKARPGEGSNFIEDITDRKPTAMAAVFALVELHETHCPDKSGMCAFNTIIDAAIFLGRTDIWHIGRANYADGIDAKIMDREAMKWRNFREVWAPPHQFMSAETET